VSSSTPSIPAADLSAASQAAGGVVVAPPAEPALAQIHVLGVQPEDAAWVKARLKAQEGSPYPADLQGEDMTFLLTCGRFTQVKLRRVPLSGTAFRLDIDLTPGVPKPAQAPPPPAEEDFLRAPWVIGEFAVKGNERVKFNVIRTQVKARAGDLYERSDLDRDIQAVLSLGQFERVAADIEPLPDKPVPPHLLGIAASSVCASLTFLVEEKMLVRKIRYTGHKGLSKGKLSDEAGLKAKDPFDKVKLNEDAGKMLDLYRKKGYLQAVVRSTYTVDAAARQVDVEFLIEEGPKSRIAEVRLSGVSAFKPKKVLKKMENRRKKVYDAAKLPEDLKKIEALYKNEGYLDFEVLSSSVSFSDDGSKVFIDLVLKEGPQYRFGETTFAGHTVYKSSDLAKAVDYRKGKLFSQERFDFTIRNLQELYAEKGRLRTRVTPAKTFNEATKLMDVRYDIEEGNVVYVDHIDIEGNKTTKAFVFKRELVIKEGMPFQVSKIRKSQEKILNLGFIDDVQLDIQNPIDPDRADLTFDIVEGKPGMLTAGAGFSSLDGLVGTMSLQHMNLFGRAQRASVQWSFGSRVQDYNVSWTTLWTNNRPISLGFDVFNTRRISPFESSTSGYVNKRTGGGIRVGPRFQDDKYQLNFHYVIQRVQVSNIENEFASRLTESTSIQSSLTTEFARDTRDNIWDPTRGSRNGGGIELTGGVLQGDIHLLKPFFHNSLHHTLATVGDYPLVLSFSNRGGYVTQFGQTKEVPVFERYYVGGQDSLRGYTYAGEVGYPDGGKAYDVFNVELGFPLARERRKTIVKVVGFFDAGGSWDTMKAVRLRVGIAFAHVDVMG